MKKYFILIVMIVLLIISSNKQNQIQMVFEYNDEDMLTANIVIPNLNTKNFSNYFDDYTEILGIYPKINMLYKNKIGKLFYSFNQSTVKENLLSFTKYYKNILKKNNYNNDLILTDYNGVSIEKVKVFLTYDKLNELLKKCKDCSYEKIPD